MRINLFCFLQAFYVILIILFAHDAGYSQNDFEWECSGAVFTPGKKGSFDEISVKDPSIVFYQKHWHLFYTARNKQEYTTGYVSHKNLQNLNLAERHELSMIRGISRYGCAPQVFYFEPQQKWYLIFQNRDSNYQPVFSTNDNIFNPESWSNYQNLIKKDTQKKWIDFWIIAFKEKMYLFYTEAHNGVMMRSTSIEKFPRGWGNSKLVYPQIHEAAHVYKVLGKTEFHMIYELNNDGVRSFGLAKANHPEGPWKKVTNSYATGKQLQFAENIKTWTEMVSHGEVFRTGYNQDMEYDPLNCKWLIQGILKKELDNRYEMLPWNLGIINVNSK